MTESKPAERSSVPKKAYIAAERDTWERPRLISGPYRFTPESRSEYMEDFVEAKMNPEYTDVWSVLRFIDDEGRKPRADDPSVISFEEVSRDE